MISTMANAMMAASQADLRLRRTSLAILPRSELGLFRSRDSTRCALSGSSRDGTAVEHLFASPGAVFSRLQHCVNDRSAQQQRKVGKRRVEVGDRRALARRPRKLRALRQQVGAGADRRDQIQATHTEK